MLRSEPKIPASLFEIQDWFQSVITLPIDRNNQICSSRSISEEAENYISPNAQLSSQERIQIYHQQYWWRLLGHLHEMFPTLVRLFGYADFNLCIGVPYLMKYPSRHWSLSKLGSQMAKWIDEDYNENDKLLIFFSAVLDWAYEEVFFAPSPVCFPPSEHMLTQKIAFQSHVKIFKLPFNLFSFRTNLLKEKPDFWFENEFPKLPKEKDYYFIIFRNAHQRIVYQEVPQGHWSLLNLIQSGKSIKEACDSLEEHGGEPFEQAKTALPDWIQEWISKNWLGIV